MPSWKMVAYKYRNLHKFSNIQKNCLQDYEWSPKYVKSQRKCQEWICRFKNNFVLNDVKRFGHYVPRILLILSNVDETWVHFYDPEWKQESMNWHTKGGPAPKKPRVIYSAGKNFCWSVDPQFHSKNVLLLKCISYFQIK